MVSCCIYGVGAVLPPVMVSATWVLQEVANSVEPVAQLGPLRFQWGSVILASYWQEHAWKYIPDWEEQLDSSRGELPLLWRAIAWAGTSKRSRIIDILFDADVFEATDPRDSVWALLGLAKDTYQIYQLPATLRPDYSNTGVQAYTDFTRGLIDLYGILEVFSLI